MMETSRFLFKDIRVASVDVRGTTSEGEFIFVQPACGVHISQKTVVVPEEFPSVSVGHFPLEEKKELLLKMKQIGAIIRKSNAVSISKNDRQRIHSIIKYRMDEF